MGKIVETCCRPHYSDSKLTWTHLTWFQQPCRKIPHQLVLVTSAIFSIFRNFEISTYPPHYAGGFNLSQNLKYYRFCQDFEESRTSAILDVSYSLYTFFDHFPSKYRWCNIEIPKKLKIFKLMLLCQKCLRLLGMASKLTHIQFLCVTIVIVLPHTLIIASVSHNSPFSFKFPFDVEIPIFLMYCTLGNFIL